MVAPSIGEVVVVPFPFSDLSQTKVRPAVCLANTGRGEWILCQVTSNPYGDSRAIPLAASAFARGGLRIASYARPGKVFTAHTTRLLRSVGALTDPALNGLLDRVVEVIRPRQNP